MPSEEVRREITRQIFQIDDILPENVLLHIWHNVSIAFYYFQNCITAQPESPGYSEKRTQKIAKYINPKFSTTEYTDKFDVEICFFLF